MRYLLLKSRSLRGQFNLNLFVNEFMCALSTVRFMVQIDSDLIDEIVNSASPSPLPPFAIIDASATTNVYNIISHPRVFILYFIAAICILLLGTGSKFLSRSFWTSSKECQRTFQKTYVLCRGLDVKSMLSLRITIGFRTFVDYLRFLGMVWYPNSTFFTFSRISDFLIPDDVSKSEMANQKVPS